MQIFNLTVGSLPRYHNTEVLSSSNNLNLLIRIKIRITNASFIH